LYRKVDEAGDKIDKGTSDSCGSCFCEKGLEEYYEPEERHAVDPKEAKYETPLGVLDYIGRED